MMSESEKRLYEKLSKGNQPCPTCNGGGEIIDFIGEVATCPSCAGSGEEGSAGLHAIFAKNNTKESR